MNILNEASDNLVAGDYSQLLDQISLALDSSKQADFFALSTNQKSLLIGVDSLARLVASKAQISNPLGSNGGDARITSSYFTRKFDEEFNDKIGKLQAQVRQKLQEFAARQNGHDSAKSFLAGLVRPLQSFKGRAGDLGLSYPFEQLNTGLQKKHLTLTTSPSAKPLLNLHKLTISVKEGQAFETQLEAGLKNYLETMLGPGASQDDRDDLEDILADLKKNTKSDFYQLQRVVDSETLGKLKREGRVRYLEFLLEHSDRKTQGVELLESLVKRLRRLEAYLNDDTKDDGHFEVNYNNRKVNFRDLMARAEAYDDLPIFPVVEGCLGETTDDQKRERSFVFGLKFKLNGKVTNQGRNAPTSFAYNLERLDLSSLAQSGAKGPQLNPFVLDKALRVAILYFFVFFKLGELDYNPVETFEKLLLDVLKNGSDEDKQKRLLNFKETLANAGVEKKLVQLKVLLKNLTRRKTALEKREYPLHISVQRGILERDRRAILNSNTFFKPVWGENGKAALKYITLGDAGVDKSSLCKLKASVTINNPQFCDTTDKQTFNMGYAIDGIKALPLLMPPRGITEVYDNYYAAHQMLVLTYDHEFLKTLTADEKSPQAFCYRFIYGLMSYICLKVLLQELGEPNLFIPIVRLHLRDKQDPSHEEEFIRGISKQLAHLLNEEYRANSQGFNIEELDKQLKAKRKTASYDQFKARNGLSSLYSVLPKVFEFPTKMEVGTPDKLAIVVVSSRKADQKWKSDFNRSCLTGEIIGIERLPGDKKVQVQPFKTFSANYDSASLFQNPVVLLDEVGKLYQQGYRHFMYIAKAPYSSRLNLTHQDRDTEEALFFMSHSIIKALRANKKDLKLYPIFFDKYWVVKLEKLEVSALYIQDTLELTQLVEDPAKQTVVFFNLFNCKTVTGANQDDRHYNGVVSYATLLNMYDGILDDGDLRQGLIYDDQSNPLKEALLQYLTLFHFSRYEASSNPTLKLDPYTGLIGDKSVGALSTFPHLSGNTEFNLLAFLTEVRRVLNVA